MLKKKKEKTLEELELEKTKKIEIIAAKEQKKGEFGAFLTLLLITLILVGGVYIWYTKFYDNERDSWLKNIFNGGSKEKYKLVSYTTEHEYKKIDKYIIDLDQEYIYKIYNLSGDILFEGEKEYTNIYIGNDKELYVIYNEEDNLNNLLTISILKDKEIDDIEEYGYEYHKFYPLINEDIYLGVVEEYSEYEDMIKKDYTVIYTLDDREQTIEDGIIQSEKYSKTEKYIHNDRYVVLKSTDTNKYSIYDIEKEKQITEYKYNQLSYIKEDLFIAKQDKKEGIINTKLKKIIEFDYNNIVYKDNYYLASKDTSIDVIDNDYNIITTLNTVGIDKLGIDPVYNLDLYNINGNLIIPMNERLLYIKEKDVIELEDNYISKNKDLIYTYNIANKTYTFYDKDFVSTIIIDLSDYDIEYTNDIFLINNTIVIGSKNPLYFDYKTGESLEEIKDYEYEINNVKYEYNGKKNTITIKDNDTEETIKYNDPTKEIININEDKTFYYLDKDNYITIKTN